MIAVTLQVQGLPPVSKLGFPVDGWATIVDGGRDNVGGDGKGGLADSDGGGSVCSVAHGGRCEHRPPLPMEAAAVSGTAPVSEGFPGRDSNA